MNGRIHISNHNDLCSLCGSRYKHRRVLHHTASRDITEVEFIHNCPRCRSLLRKFERLQNELLEIQWMLFGLAHTDYFDDEPT